MEITNSLDPNEKPPVVMLVYGEGGVGKTTFASTAPKPLLADCEGGAKYFGLRGIDVDVAHIKKWSDMRDYANAMGDYETVVIDPIGELLEKLKRYMRVQGNTKRIQSDGSPTMAGWGWLKKTMRRYLKMLRDSGKNVLIVAHVEEQKDEQRLVKRPKIQTKLADEVVNMVDIVGYMTMMNNERGDSERVIIINPESDKYIAKDRTGQLGKVIKPDFSEIVEKCQQKDHFKEREEDEEDDQEPDDEGITYKDFTKKELQDILKSRDMKVSGNKDELIERLKHDDMGLGESEEEEAEEGVVNVGKVSEEEANEKIKKKKEAIKSKMRQK